MGSWSSWPTGVWEFKFTLAFQRLTDTPWLLLGLFTHSSPALALLEKTHVAAKGRADAVFSPDHHLPAAQPGQGLSRVTCKMPLEGWTNPALSSSLRSQGRQWPPQPASLPPARNALPRPSFREHFGFHCAGAGKPPVAGSCCKTLRTCFRGRARLMARP